MGRTRKGQNKWTVIRKREKKKNWRKKKKKKKPKWGDRQRCSFWYGTNQEGAKQLDSKLNSEEGGEEELEEEDEAKVEGTIRDVVFRGG